MVCGTNWPRSLASGSRAFSRRNFTGALVGLRVLSRVAGKARHDEPDQRRTIAGSDAGDGILDQGGRRLRVRAIAFEYAKSAKSSRVIARNVAAGSLLPGRDRNAVIPLSSIKNKNGSRSVVTIFKADPEPLVAADASPPCATAISVLARLLAKLRKAIAQRLAHPTAGVYCAPTPPHTGRTHGPHFARHVEHHRRYHAHHSCRRPASWLTQERPRAQGPSRANSGRDR